ncbi:outer membrane beta-barrel protein [Bacteroides sedimenti]|uniref:PH domain-containing protein n=1 Tax=Bacteroides sedimenti TaxID=2136147 RepID=A0ABM8IF05_9BACE
MKQEEEKWVSALRNSLAEYKEPPAADGWENLMKEISPAPVVPPKRSYFIYAAAAAIILLLLIPATFFLLNESPGGVKKYNQSAQKTETIQSPVTKQAEEKIAPALKANRIKENMLAINSMVKSTGAETKRGVMIETKNLAAITENVSEADKAAVSSETEKPIVIEEKKEQRDKQHKSTEQQKRVQKGNSATKKRSEQSAERDLFSRKRIEGDLAIALYTGNGSGSSNQTSYMPMSTVTALYGDALLMAYYRNSQPVEWKHKQPVSFGLSVRKKITEHLALESGATYTRLESEGRRTGSSLRYNQTLHYVGIPLRLNYLILDKRFVSLYLSGGGMVEKSVSGKMDTETVISGNLINKTTEDVNVKPLQWSVGGAMGVQFNANKHFGLFAEPGLMYYFSDGSKVETIRKESPLNFNLQMGLRMTY